ncbi:xanthine dehydrogenase family protein molybdopterin-binding subunit [Oceaniglobus indicus]|uniref:xanthine dehydrogenase family protein molybdopterin-binding subunit n=1 Tax=Oceaniglobus indicus TaxID=2047749 RepID=UPI000C17E924|nr:molybdopterin cofactor-binding domain-containing protein [Oceaniglobus indicus]
MVKLSRRGFLRTAGSAAVAVQVVPLHKALAELQSAPKHQPPNWIRDGKIRFRQDGIPKVTGNKVFAIDIRARDMPGWPDTQSHALMLRADRADQRFGGVNETLLPDDLQPDVLIDDARVRRDGLRMTQEAFYGRLLLPVGEPARYLGQPAAVLIYHDYTRFRRARRLLQFNADALIWGAQTELPDLTPYGGARFVRIGGATPGAPDRYSPLADTIIFADFEAGGSPWPAPDRQGDAPSRGMAHAGDLRDELADPPDTWAVYQGHYTSQYVDPAALEPDNGNAWYDPERGALHVVVGTQSPYTNADHIETMVKGSRFDLNELRLHPGYTVGYGQKEHHVFPYYVALAALYGEGRPVRFALDRYSHFQGAIKRHPFDTRMTLAVDRETGLFQSLAADLRANGGGTKNFSPSVGQVAASALQGIHYFPKSDISVQVDASRAPTAGSMRGYGTLQSMVAFELLVDEAATDLGIDPIELRRRNLMHSGMKNTQGAIPAGTMRAGELLDAAGADPLWTTRAERKAAFEAEHPGYRYGVGVSCVQKDYGTGAEAALVRLEVTPEGELHMRHVASEIGCGSTTSQMLMTEAHLGRYCDRVDFAVIDWPELPLHSNNEPYTMSQDDQDEAAQDPHWVPRITSPRSASNSAYYFSHATGEAARLLFDLGLWQAAQSIWHEGIGGGQAAPLAVRRDQAEWRDGHLVAGGLQPLSFGDLARRAHAQGLITGVTVHTFNRWAWASAEFDVDGTPVSGAIDALSVKWGEGADAAKRARMRDAGFAFQPRTRVDYPPVQRNNASVVYYAPQATMVELSVNTGSGEVQILSHKSWMECGNMIVPELVSGQLQGGIAMGIGHALYEELLLYEDGPGNGTWNFNRYRLPRARDVAVWSQQGDVAPPLSATDPPKGIAEVVMIPVVSAICNAVHDAIGVRFHETPLSPERIKEALS